VVGWWAGVVDLAAGLDHDLAARSRKRKRRDCGLGTCDAPTGGWKPA
jgi:hypothetical protein